MFNKKNRLKAFILIATVCLSLQSSTLFAQEKQQPANIPVEPELKAWKIKGPGFMSKWKAGVATLNPENRKKLHIVSGTNQNLALVNESKGGLDIYTQQDFGDCLIELEVMVAEDSNSGIYVMGQYEVQIKDSFGKNYFLGAGDMGGIIGTSRPKQNAAKKPGQWQNIVIEFKAPRFQNGKRITPAEFVRVTLNGITVQKHVLMRDGPTSGALRNGEFARGPLMLQGGLGAVAYRSIRISDRPAQK